MKKILLALTLAIFLIPLAALANGSATDVATVKKTGYDEQIVVLQGVVTEQIRHDKYLFRDDTGTIVMEIDDKYWPDRRPALNTRLRVTGEVEYEHGQIEIDAKRVDVL